MTALKRQRNRKPGWYVIVSVIVIVGVYFFYNSCRNITDIMRFVRMKHKEEKVLREALVKKEALLLERKRLLNDSTYIEEIARREYGMIRKGEEIFKISLPDSEQTGGKDAHQKNKK